MPFNIACPNCSMSLAATESDVGKQGKCSRCGTVFTITMPQFGAPPPLQTQYQPTPSYADVTPGVIRVGEGISRGFSVLHANLGVFVLIALCFLGISFGIAIAGQIPCLGFIIALANGFVIQPALTCGFYRACFKQHDGSQAEVGDLFAEFSQWVDILLLSLATVGIMILVCFPGLIVFGIGFAPTIMGLIRGQQSPPEPSWPILIAGGVLLFLSAIIAGMALMFTYPALVDRRKGVGDAIQTSWQLMSSNPMGALGSILLSGLIGLVGFLACCVGLLYAMPAVQCMFTAIYRTATPPHAWVQAPPYGAPPAWPSQPAGPATPLPPPTAPPA